MKMRRISIIITISIFLSLFCLCATAETQLYCLKPAIGVTSTSNNFPVYNSPEWKAGGYSGGSYWRNHRGTDISAPKNTPVLAARSGTVTKIVNSTSSSGRGTYVVVRDAEYSNLWFVYQHLAANSAFVKVGDTVHVGDLLALSGDTGSGGVHLHFEVQYGESVYGTGFKSGNGIYLNPNYGTNQNGFNASAYKVLNTSGSVTGDGRCYKDTAERNSYITETDVGLVITYYSNWNQPVYSNLRIMYRYPANYKISSSGWAVKGWITSGAKITTLKVWIEDSNGNALYTPTVVTPNAYYYSLSSISSKILFSKISKAGTYYYCIFAEDEQGRTTSVRQAFTASSSSTSEKFNFILSDASSVAEDPYITLGTDAKYPSGDLGNVTNFGLYGTITSNETITSVVATIYDQYTGEPVRVFSAGENPIELTPNSKTFNINTSTINKKFTFSDLTDGAYRYEIIVSTSSGYSQTVIDSKFTIGNGTEPIILPEVVEIYCWDTPMDNEINHYTIGTEVALYAIVGPLDVDQEVEWRSSNTATATISQEGELKIVGYGTAVISAHAKADTSIYASFTVVVECLVDSIVLDTSNHFMNAGDTFSLSHTVSPSNATNKSVAWASSNTSVAVVDSNGKVTARTPGIAIITVASTDGSNRSASCTVTVTQPVTGISLNTSTLALNTNDTATMTATISPSNASNKTVTWKSSDTTVATVDSNGKVTAKGPGSATITVTAADGSGKTATCTVTVTQLVTGITLNPTSLALDVGASSTLIATVSPSNASNKAVSWSSGNTAVAIVDSNGKVTAKAPGTAVITASAQDGSGVYATCSVTVTQPVTSVTLDQHSAAMIVGDAISLTATVKPDNASNKAVTWSSSDSSVAAVDANGTVTAKNPGSTVITVTAADGSGCSDACTITVEQPVVSISLTPNSATMNVGDIVTVAATISPANASNKAVKWSSSNPSVATVSANGTINAVSWGTATIQCTAEDGYGAMAGISIIVSGNVMTNPDTVLPAATTLIEDEAFMGVAATSVKLPDRLVTIGARAFANCKQLTQVYIPKSVTSIHATSFDGTSSLVIYGYRNSYAEEYAAQYGYAFVQLDPVQVILPTEITISGSTVLNVNSTAQLQAVVSPDNVTDDTVTWSSSDTSVATVDQNGLVTAITRGYVAITATATADPRITASWSMEVKQPVTKITISGTTTVKEGATAQLTATVEPADANCKAVTWTSSNTSVATVNSSGVVTAINAGTTVITATATDGPNISGKVTITVSPATFSVNFDANGGSCSTSSITATRNAPLGNLPTATRDYYRFDGWYTAKSGGSEVTADTVYSTASNVTLYAHWTINPESGWVLESQVPAGAQITATSWSYTESTESTASTMSGWTPNGSYWRQTGTGSKQYASFPGGYDTSNVYYTTLDKSPYTASETATAKREVVDEWAGYIYWHWMYSCTYTPSSTANRTISTTKQWASAAGASDDVYFQYFFAMASTVDCKSNSTTSAYSRPSGLETWNCSSIIPSLTTEAQRTSKTSGLGTDRFYRFSYYTSTYTDYEKVFKYYRVLEYQTSDPGTGDNITEKIKYVKYREK